jgi:hypothetical protein
MGELSFVPSEDPDKPSPTRTGEAATPTLIDDVRCALCGASLVGKRKRYRLVSPLTSMGTVTVCWICRRAALGEGYRPAS